MLDTGYQWAVRCSVPCRDITRFTAQYKQLEARLVNSTVTAVAMFLLCYGYLFG